ncbi:unnamed protein product [Didymodactylos carnosus]|uniref:TRPM-like domain-containing protein n=1 Tax=Didymodactylos carnosus TaxID=1234261 RepID=A0A8S2H9Q2_9BILA|nr:unnamed protein product [Didymodactylos carnosus]CAF3618487.1 unnamed protein product [Didymodactylos carnosus]
MFGTSEPSSPEGAIIGTSEPSLSRGATRARESPEIDEGSEIPLERLYRGSEPTKTVTEIVRQMKDEWNLKTPSVILSIIGTTWIITESANTQIMIDINEAIEQYCDNDSKAPTWITIENSNPKNGINEHLTTFLKEKITKKYGNYYLKLDNKIYDRFEIEQECCRLVNLSNEENVFIEIIKQTTKLNEFMEDNIDNQAQNQIDMIAQDLLIILNNLYDVISSEYALMQSNIGVLRTVQWKINIFKSKVKELLQNISSNYLVQLVEQIFDDAYDLSAICKNLTIPLVYILVGEEASLNEGIFLGDNTSIETVRKVVDEGIPVIVINGTEGVASVIGSLYGSIHDTSARNETEERYNPTTPNTPLHTRLERHSLVRVQEKRESFKTIDQNALNKLLQPENGNFGIFMYQPGDQHLNQVLLQAIAKDFLRDLFLWALETNNYTIAMAICSRLQNPLVASLVACQRFDRKLNRTPQEIEKEQLFNEYAVNLIDECFNSDPKRAIRLLTKPSQMLFHQNPLQLAKYIRFKKFIATKCVQTYYNQIWYGPLETDEIQHHIDLLACMFVTNDSGTTKNLESQSPWFKNLVEVKPIEFQGILHKISMHSYNHLGRHTLLPSYYMFLQYQGDLAEVKSTEFQGLSHEISTHSYNQLDGHKLIPWH